MLIASIKNRAWNESNPVKYNVNEAMTLPFLSKKKPFYHQKIFTQLKAK